MVIGNKNQKKSESETEGTYTMRYSVRLLIRHPSIDPAIITEQLGLVPSRCWRFGESRMTPTGTPLVGLWKNSSWSWRLGECRGKRAFFESVNNLIVQLEPHSNFLSDLISTGGDICLIIDILGKANIGDVLSWQSMEKIVKLKIDLGIEVFPDEREH